MFTFDGYEKMKAGVNYLSLELSDVGLLLVWHFCKRKFKESNIDITI